MQERLKKTSLSIAISSVLTASLSISAYAAPCGGYIVNEVCEQSKFGPNELHEISAGDGIILGSEDNHFVIQGDGYELYNPINHFRIQISSGTVKFMEVNDSWFSISGTRTSGSNISIYARAENTTLNNSAMWVMTTADQTVARGNSHVMVSTQFANDGLTYVETNDDGTVWYAPIVTNGRYYDNSKETLWGIHREDKGWDTVATSKNSTFFNGSNQLVSTNGRSIDAIFNDESFQQVTNLAVANNAIFNHSSSQTLYAGSEANNTTLNDNSYSWVKAGAKISGTTLVNNSAIIYMDSATDGGAVADKIVLNGNNSTLVVLHSSHDNALATVSDLNLQGGSVVFQNGGADNYADLQVGTLSGSGIFSFNTTINQGKGNMLYIDNGSGNHKVIIKDSGEEITSPDNQTLNIINDKSSGANFSLVSLSGEEIVSVDGGVYMYVLKQMNDKDGLTGNTWYLGADWQATANPGPEPGPNPNPNPNPEPEPSPNPDPEPGPNPDPEVVPPSVILPPASEQKTTPSTDAVLSMASASQFIFDGELQNLRLRKGDLRNNAGDNFGAWGRYLSNNTRVNASSGAAYKLQQDGFEIGGDKAVKLATGKVLIGGFTAYSYNKLKHDRGGNSSIDSYSLGVYATYFDNSGYYLDGVLKANRFNNSLNALTTNGDIAKSDYHQYAVGVSVETGYNYQLNQGLFVEPYLRASYFSAESKDITLNNGMKADLGHNRSAKGEFGMTLGKTFDLDKGTKLSPYVKAAIEHEFIKTNEVQINQHYNFNNDFSGSMGKYGLGINATVSEKTSFYMELNYRNGSQIESPIQGNVGFRYNF